MYFQVEGMVLMVESLMPVLCLYTALAYDLTDDEPPAQDHAVDQARVVPEREVYVVHWLPEVAADSPHRLLYRVYVPVATESHCPQKVLALFSMVAVGAAQALPARKAGRRSEVKSMLKE